MLKPSLVFSLVLLGCALVAANPATADPSSPGKTNDAPQSSQPVPISDWGKGRYAGALPTYSELLVVQKEIEDLRREVAALREAKTTGTPAMDKAGK